MPNRKHQYSEATAQQVETMSAMGLNIAMIQAITEVDKMTLYKYYAPYLMVGKTKANLKVAQRVFALATENGVPPATQLQACIFWLKTQAGWKEGVDVNISGNINHNTQLQVNFIETNVKDIKAIPAKGRIPRKEIGYKNAEPWEPTFIG